MRFRSHETGISTSSVPSDRRLERISPDSRHDWLGSPGEKELAIEQIGRNCRAGALATVDRQAAPSWPCYKACVCIRRSMRCKPHK